MKPNILVQSAIAFAIGTVSLAAASCSSSAPDEEAAVSAAALVASDVMGFESTGGWSLTTGSASLTTNRTQGADAFALVPNGWLQLTSAPLATLAGATGTLAIDLAMPPTAPNPYWLGTLQVSVTMPSRGLSNVLVGQTDLGTLALGRYTTIDYTVPAKVTAALSGTYTDLQFVVVINVPGSTTATYLLDNLRFLAGADAGTADAADGRGDGTIDAPDTADAHGDATTDATDARGDAATDAGDATEAGDATMDASDARADSSDAMASDTGASCGACPSGTGCAPNGLCLTTDLTVWPNVQSQANSDTWISQNHASIRQMNLRVLAINFANTDHAYRANSTTTFAEMKQKISANTCSGVSCDIFAGLSLGSKYHGYSASTSAPFLDYTLAYAVDLSDKGSPPPGWNHNNSSKYPIKCVAGDGYQFNYAALFSSQFAAYYNIRDVNGNLLTLAQAVQQGLVHDVFIYVDGDNWVPGSTFGSCASNANCAAGQVCNQGTCYVADGYTCNNGVAMSDFQLPEVLEWKQNYTDPGGTTNPSQKIAGSFNPAAGNGQFDTDDQTPLQTLGRSIRILYVNAQRGSGCALHSLGHSIEHSVTSVPALGDDFTHFANFDLMSKVATPSSPPFANWYALYDPTNTSQNVITLLYPDGGTISNSVSWSGDYANGIATKGTIPNYNQGCGSVHYPPNARQGYDDTNSMFAYATCETYGLHGTGGLDSQTAVNDAKWTTSQNGQPVFNDVAENDCEGGWNIYWRQSFPGYGNGATGSTSSGRSNGIPIKSWWPYLYY